MTKFVYPDGSVSDSLQKSGSGKPKFITIGGKKVPLNTGSASHGPKPETAEHREAGKNSRRNIAEYTEHASKEAEGNRDRAEQLLQDHRAGGPWLSKEDVNFIQRFHPDDDVRDPKAFITNGPGKYAYRPAGKMRGEPDTLRSPDPKDNEFFDDKR
jgi:hypothetical protein